jgi:cytochrome c biogenesis protein CcmG/thiol:disulfide interchange protein DsbE
MPHAGVPHVIGPRSVRGGPGRWILLLPVVAFIGLATALALGLNRDPRAIPSALIGRAVPTFQLSPVQGRARGLSSSDLKGDVSLVNVFASWCVACREEHSLLMRLKESAIVAIHGLDYKDAPSDAAAWLDRLGDPYSRTGADFSGRVAIDWGVYGVPETYVIDRAGRVAHKHVGALTAAVMRDEILPLIERLRR